MSVVVFYAITCGLVGIPLMIPVVAEWLESLQLIQTAMVFSLYVFIMWLIVTLIFGRVYCSTVCPLGTFMDIMSRRGSTTMRSTYHYSRPLNHLRYSALVVTLVCLMGGYFIVATLLDPYAVWARIDESLLRPLYTLIGFVPDPHYDNRQWWTAAGVNVATVSVMSIGVAIVLLLAIAQAAWRKGRIVCNAICPVGTTLGFISRFAIFQIEIDTDKCIQCRRCENVCKAECLDLIDHVVDGSRCINCFNCINVCPNDAIHYTPRRKQLSIPMMQKISGLTTANQCGGGASSTNNTQQSASKTDNPSICDPT